MPWPQRMLAAACSTSTPITGCQRSYTRERYKPEGRMPAALLGAGLVAGADTGADAWADTVPNVTNNASTADSALCLLT